MSKFRIKVCGITHPADAVLAAKCGADMIGMIFYRRSPRFANQATARSILRAIPPTMASVGVFVDEEQEKVLRIASKLHLDFVQLHGCESASYIASIRKHGFRVIKSFVIRRPSDFLAVLKSQADLCLLDHKTDKLHGGTGQPFDWSLRPPKKMTNLMLAGGVTAENLEEGVRAFDPLVVDVNSGVESAPGIKSKNKLKKFFMEADRIRYGC
ncbi:MAG: N-(5'-phosphoribosyl)anthranilate isomerase [Candidatus Zixiibacteriota bacterium]|nr:MAG: N-(5'-phosphoribosyl)anthranilate isomerase [candidate division Zixibacteria bacterium]